MVMYRGVWRYVEGCMVMYRGVWRYVEVYGDEQVCMVIYSLANLLGNESLWFVICDWWMSIRYVCMGCMVLYRGVW